MATRAKNRGHNSAGGLAWSLTLAAVLVASAAPCTAQDAYFCIDELSDQAVSHRIKKIERTFKEGRDKALGWRIGWIAGFFAISAVQTALAVNAAQNDKPWDRFNFAYAAAGSGALMLGLSVLPMPSVWGLKRIRQEPDATPEQRREKLRYATRLLERGASIETMIGSERAVLPAVVFGAVGGSIKAAKWPGRTRGNTALTFLLPPAVAIASALTAPRHMRKGWEQYRGMACTERYHDPGPDPELNVSVAPGGLSLTVAF